MNLLPNKKVFITESIWIALLDESNTDHDEVNRSFAALLELHYDLMTSSYVIEAVLERLKQTLSSEIAQKFIDVIDRAVLGNYLKIIWLSRRMRRNALDKFLKNEDKQLSLTLNIELMKQKNIYRVFTLNAELYDKHDIRCLKFS